MEKFYTPGISEFHIGFECEVLSQSKMATEIGRQMDSKMLDFKYEPNIGACFVPHKINERDIQFYFLNPHILVHEIRVKYLDREDIESLKWEKTSAGGIAEASGVFRFQITSTKMPLGFNRSNTYVLTILGHPTLILISNEGHTLFSGNILNKSELSRIMKMVGI